MSTTLPPEGSGKGPQFTTAWYTNTINNNNNNRSNKNSSNRNSNTTTTTTAITEQQ